MLAHWLTPAPSPHHQWDPWPQSPSPASTMPPAMDLMPSFSSASSDLPSPPPTRLPVDFSPPLIAMVAMIATVCIITTFSRQFVKLYRRYRRRRQRYGTSSSPGDIASPPYSFDSPRDANFHILSPNGLDESVIKTVPLSVYARKSGFHDCAVCLLQYEENDCVRTLPICSHAFHVDCIDTWLRSHPNCPLCRSEIFRQDSPFRPLMAARIRPNLDDMIVESTILQPLPEISAESDGTTLGEITQEPSPRQDNINQQDDRFNGQDFLLKRSYSFGFERNLGSERLVMGSSTASPWGYRRGGVGNFWSKRRSPFSSLTKPRVFSFNYYRGMKSPFFRRRNLGGFLPFSESSARHGFSSGGGSSRQSKSFASPIFMRSSATSTSTATAGFFSSSRQRSGDPEALLSPERLNREVD